MDKIQEVKELWDRRPYNIRHSPMEVGTREYFDEVEARKCFVELHISKFAQFKDGGVKRSLRLDVVLEQIQ